MEYKGKLYGKAGNKYFDTGFTTDDWNKMEADSTKGAEVDVTATLDLHEQLNIAKIALENIKDWNEASEDIWDDPGNCASEALNKITELKSKVSVPNKEVAESGEIEVSLDTEKMEQHPVMLIDPEKEYMVSYLAPHQSISRMYEYSEEGFKLLGKDLSEKQVFEVAFVEKHLARIKELQNQYANTPVSPSPELLEEDILQQAKEFLHQTVKARKCLCYKMPFIIYDDVAKMMVEFTQISHLKSNVSPETKKEEEAVKDGWIELMNRGICYKSNKPCKYGCTGLCKDSQ